MTRATIKRVWTTQDGVRMADAVIPGQGGVLIRLARPREPGQHIIVDRAKPFGEWREVTA